MRSVHAERPAAPFCAVHWPRHSPARRPRRKGQPQPGADLLGQRVELLCGKGGQILPGVGGRLADIPQCRHQRRAEFVSQCLPALWE